jgi:hypothetical protein
MCSSCCYKFLCILFVSFLTDTYICVYVHTHILFSYLKWPRNDEQTKYLIISTHCFVGKSHTFCYTCLFSPLWKLRTSLTYNYENTSLGLEFLGLCALSIASFSKMDLLNMGQWTESRTKLLLSVMYHHQNCLELTWCLSLIIKVWCGTEHILYFQNTWPCSTL